MIAAGLALVPGACGSAARDGVVKAPPEVLAGGMGATVGTTQAGMSATVRTGQAGLSATVGTGQAGMSATGGPGGPGDGPSESATAAVQVDPEAVDPGLRREHDRLLAERPAFQHLPYRDREIGVDFDRVTGDGRLELLVTYLGSRAGAVRDLDRLLSRYRDPGTAYVERYEPVF